MGGMLAKDSARLGTPKCVARASVHPDTFSGCYSGTLWRHGSIAVACYDLRSWGEQCKTDRQSEILHRLKQEVQELLETQSKALQQLVYVRMDTKEAKQYDQRRTSLLDCLEQLQTLEASRQGPAPSDASQANCVIEGLPQGLREN